MARTLGLSLMMVAFLAKVVSAREFEGATEHKSANNPVHCGALVQRCMLRCESRDAEGHEGIEYVQWSINFVDSTTMCDVRATSGSEMVSANPPNDNKLLVLFNVPCCQQKPIADEVGAKPCTPLMDASDPLTAATTTTTTTTSTAKPSSTLQRVASPPEKVTDEISDKDNHGWASIFKNDLNLIFTIMCFVLILIVLLLIVNRMIKKKFQRKALKKSTAQTSPVTSTTSNGGVQPTTLNETADETSKRNPHDVLNNAFKEIEPPPTTNEYANEDVTVTKFQPRDDGNNLDYVVLDPVMSSAPKSARSSRNRGQSSKSEEVMIIGAGRHHYRSQTVPNGNVGNFQKVDFSYDAGAQSGHTQNGDSSPIVPPRTPPTSIRPQLPGRNSEATSAAYTQRRSGSLPERTTDDAAYDNLAADITVVDKSNAKENNNTEQVGRPFGTTSLSATLPNNTHIYNVLRSDKNDQPSDYQRLKRSQRVRNKEVSSTKDKDQDQDDVEKGLTSAEDVDTDYVKDFQILKKTPPVEITEEKQNHKKKAKLERGYAYAEDVKQPTQIPNGTAKTMNADTVNASDDKKQANANKNIQSGVNLPETDDL